MPDQADMLRQLVRRATAEVAPGASSQRLLVVCGGKGGVGTTTVAVQLAATLAALGRPTVLVDADLGRADATSMCRLQPQLGIVELLTGRFGAERLLLTHAAGMSVLPAVWAPAAQYEPTPGAGRRLVTELQRLADETHWVVVDAGSQRTALHGQLWQAASRVVLVTTTDDVAVMDAYSRVKLQCSVDASTRLGVVINRAARRTSPAEIHGRLEQACRRFLGITLECWGQVPKSQALETSGGRWPSLPATDPAVARAMQRLAQSVMGTDPIARATAGPLGAPGATAGSPSSADVRRVSHGAATPAPALQHR